jgi:hypothetical protein
VLANLTEMSTNGYADKTLTKTLWVVTAGGVGAAASGAYAQQTWTFTNAGGANTVYGYFITDVTSGLLLWVEAFASAEGDPEQRRSDSHHADHHQLAHVISR